VTAPADPRPGSARAWIHAARPATLPASVVPVLVGTACAAHEGGVRVGPALGAGAAAMLLQIAANLANDVFDHEKGADREGRLGPLRVVQAGLLSARAVRGAVAVTLGLALGVGAYLAWVGGVPIVAIGVLSMISAVAYTGGPYPLGYHGLGDLFVMVFFGFVAVCGTTYLQTLHLPELAIWASIPVGSVIVAILVVNNLRDLPADARAGKRTLAVRLGRRATLAEYVGLLALTEAAPVALVSSGQLSVWGLLPLASLPLAVWLVRGVIRDQGRALNQRLVQTGRLAAVFGLLFSLGIVLP
jgi:1,4-dihydroxy-2-naphthoate polyprenyltransferase